MQLHACDFKWKNFSGWDDFREKSKYLEEFGKKKHVDYSHVLFY